jgi:hypothetical protein
MKRVRDERRLGCLVGVSTRAFDCAQFSFYIDLITLTKDGLRLQERTSVVAESLYIGKEGNP